MPQVNNIYHRLHANMPKHSNPNRELKYGSQEAKEKQIKEN